ncbi:AAA family ATPase [Paenibacillus sp. FJAT-27812]|uniref:AAA family ATPase n=1 Tax=Paenibacillus sp. FJAT-27812 TaxID=1684143 RepID=UPI0006A7CD5A|nr:AAA family ATPase [Paenibacillus sp. FJAT-27812]
MDNNNGTTNLSAYMKKNRIDFQAFISISLALAELLQKQHLRGLIQQNINPDNILIRFPSGRLTLQLIHPSKMMPVDGQTFLSQDDLIQALAYISPEQTGRMKRKIDGRSDLYALGVLLYELLTGELPFKARTANEWIHAHMALLPTPPRTLNPNVPQIINDLVLKLLSKTAGNRYQTAYGLHADLLKCSDRLKTDSIHEAFPLGESDEISRFRLPNRLYGREKELQELLDAYESSYSGSMELVLIGGHAGSGKTALVKEIQTSVRHKKGYFITGKFDQLNQSIPFEALIAAFRELIRQILAGTEEQIAEWRKKLLKALGQSGMVITEVIAELTLIIGEQPPVEDSSPAESTHRFQTLFSKFIKVFADKKHPVVISLDDLQWADPASLDLLQVLINDPSNKYLLIIGTYRNNEIDDEQLLAKMFFDNLRVKDSGIHFIKIDPLGYLDVIQYVADVLHDKASRIKPLAEIIYQKTAGNPFYVQQLLQFIFDEKLLYFNSKHARWDWHIKSIKEREGFKDVMSLIVGRFNTLPEETRQLLRLGGCIGNTFDIRTLSMLYERDAAHTEQSLLPALNEGLLLIEKERYIFLHDRVQKAAYDLIPDEEKNNVHLRIGRSMLRFFGTEETDDHLFEVVHHLNLGSSFMADQAEMEQLARLNLRAGKKAKASTAYVQALALLKTGAQLIEAQGWSRQDALYYNLLLESTECEYFCGNFAQAESILEQLLRHSSSQTDRARVYIIQLMMYAYRKREHEAGEIALKAMEEFGLYIPAKPSRLTIAAEITYTQLWLASNPGLIKALPVSRDPLHKALAEIVMASSSILFIINEESSLVLFTKYVRVSLKQGNSEAFSIALGSYAIAVCFGLKRYKTALRLAEIALNHSEKIDSVLLKGKMHFIMGLILQFLRPQEAGLHFQRSEQLSLEGGDMIYAGYAISSRLITGSEDLRHLNHICNQHEEQAIRALDRMTLRVIYQTRQYVHLLQSTQETELTFDCEHFQEESLRREEVLNNTYKGNRYYYYTCKLEIYYLFGHYSEVAVLAEESAEFEMGTVLSFNQRHSFYHALAITAIYPHASDSVRRSYRKVLNKLLARMKKWTKVVPESTLSKHRLMQAEIARLDQEHAKAEKLYVLAIQMAQKSGSPRDEAIASERAAHYYLSMDKHKIAETYLQDACRAYFKWGALGKIKRMQEIHPILEKLSFIETDAAEAIYGDDLEIVAVDNGLNRGLDKELDMDTLRQASKIVSKDKAEADLLWKFLDLAISNAGAEKGLILLGREGTLMVEAEKDINRDQVEPADYIDHYSTAVVQFVMRTRESVVLGEACHSIFAADPYIRLKRPKSILCLPISYPDHRFGVLYLENNLTSDAFSKDRLEVLEMLFSRMAYLKLWQSQMHVGGEAAETASVKAAPPLVESLTNREMEIIRLMADGLTNKEIALRLEITEGTVKIHAFNIYGKLQVNRRVQAISKVRELRLLD